jgi:hypothetical protein
MTGYLQRLAAGVSQPQPRLHPLVGSIFSGERQEMAAPDLLQNDPLAPTDDQNLISTTRTFSDSTDGPMRRRDQAAKDRAAQHAGITLPPDDRRAEQRRSDREIFHPLLPRKTGELGVSAMLPETISEDAANTQSASIGLQHNPLVASSADTVQTAPVVVRDGSTADRRNATAPPSVSGLRTRAEMLTVLAGDAGRPVRAEFSAPSRRSAQGDDIQIHIGRIEVTAVAQPMPRPAAVPARKAMSLGEYLGRRSRGAR